jgi:DNA-binding CsgD family transcriptional regulator
VPEAVERLEACARLDDATGVHNPAAVLWRPDLVEAYVRAGRPRDALRQVRDLEQLADGTGLRLARATALRGRAMLADDAGFRTAFERALHAHEDLGQPFEQARTLLAFGERLRRGRHRAEARAPLARALEIFEDLGARAWSARARAELEATGRPGGRRPAADAAELTSHERQVAALVAKGMTNREAAAALFLSPKTIEYHLGQIYRKLGVRSRTQLARAFALDGAADEAQAGPVAVLAA